jgi:ribokinase
VRRLETRLLDDEAHLVRHVEHCLAGGGHIMCVPSVVVLGSINMDLVVRVARLPRPGDTVLGERLLTIPGGKGANQAVAAARLGASVRMVGRVGADAFGSVLRDGLREDGVDVSSVAVDQTEPSGAALIVVEEGGENTVTVAPGANGHVGEEDVGRLGLNQGDVLVMQLEIPLAAVEAALDAAHRAGVRVILNAAPSEQLVGRSAPAVDVLVVNESECRDLGGVAALQRGRALVVTLGSEGSILYEDGRETHVEPHRVHAVDATAAGDAFVGALALAFARGDALVDAVRLGNAAGAAAATKLGARPSLPRPEDLER